MTRTPSSTGPQSCPASDNELERYAKCKRGFTCNDCSHFGMCDAEPPCSRPITPAPELPRLTDAEFGHIALRLNDCRCDTCKAISVKLCDARKGQREREAALIQRTREEVLKEIVQLKNNAMEVRTYHDGQAYAYERITRLLRQQPGGEDGGAGK